MDGFHEPRILVYLLLSAPLVFSTLRSDCRIAIKLQPKIYPGFPIGPVAHGVNLNVLSRLLTVIVLENIFARSLAVL